LRSSTADPPVTVAIVSWNTRDLLQRCLRSLASEVEGGRAAAWVVDNGSTDGSVEAGRRTAPWATFVEPGENLGFGRAVNLVARRTRSPWIAAANADVALEPGALATLLRAGSHPSIGCVAPRLILPDGGTQHSVYPFPTVPFTLTFNLGLYLLSRRLADRLCLEGFWYPGRARDVPWAIGAFLLLRRAAFDAVGGFDEHQWMYAEDLDLGWRLSSDGWVTRYEPGAHVRHERSAATAAAFGADRRALFMGATYAAVARRRGRARMWAVAAISIAGAALRLALIAPLTPFAARFAARWRDIRGWLLAHVRGVRLAAAQPAPPKRPRTSQREGP
jgi:GT2 family glycosyltransferase